VGSPCETDADCGSNGYCALSVFDYFECVEAECQTDADCPEGRICACNDVSEVGGLGKCHVASCTTDGDCEGRALCVSPMYHGGCYGTETSQFHCQSTADECWGTDTCAGNPGECARDQASSRFVCIAGEACGRPFLVDGVARRARAVSASEWSLIDEHASTPADLSEDERRVVARHFVEAALMEHASIAAFARFVLQLLGLGAPPHLVEGATRAMADETCHAQMCFGLARRYGAPTLGPGPLAMEGALARVELLDVALLVIAEGCVGETVAALEAAWAADEAEVPEVRRALETIAEDEARHAALAFRFVAWAAERDDRVPALLEQYLAEARRRGAGPPEDDDSLPERSRRLARHGVLDPSARREARRRALDEIIPAIVGVPARSSLSDRVGRAENRC
jgi:hypothetical protein